MEVLLVLQVIVVVAMIAAILVQKSGADGFTGGSSPNSFMTGRASANLFTRITSVLATIFIVNSMVLAYIASHSERAGSILEQAADEVSKENKNTGKPVSKDALSDLENKMKTLTSQPATPVQKKEENPTKQAPASPAPAQPTAPAVPVSE